MNEQLHPNWRALATVDFSLKRFVRGDELQSQTKSRSKSPNTAPSGNEGVEVQKFYENITNGSKSNTATIAPSLPYQSSAAEEQSLLLPFDRHKFFRYATTNNTTELSRFHYSENDLNLCDEFGWSGLMMAACEGAADAVKILLQFGADRDIKDKAGRTAADLAQIKGFYHIVRILQKIDKDNHTNTNQTEKSLFSSMKEPFFCNNCDHAFTDTDRHKHLTSTLHQFNTNPKHGEKDKFNKFNVCTKNRGLQLMVKQGWDRESGLGPTSNGRLYPVKTVIRKSRTGLGIEQSPARVTHFNASDKRAIEHNQLGSSHRNKQSRSRNDIKRIKLREWKRERRLRQELS